ncbi:MAG: hypothetical protein IPG32_20130 [Saprospirales bacterium]|nr:hypothetical protein [Saprospirales bacterium]
MRIPTKKFPFALFIAFAAGLFSCNIQEKITTPPPTILIDFKVDSFLDFPLESSKDAFFVILPEKKNVVYIFNNPEGTRVLNLSTRDTLVPSPLNGLLSLRSVNKSYVKADPFEPGLLWVRSNNLYKYDALAGKMDTLPPYQSSPAFALTKDFLIQEGIVLMTRDFIPLDTLHPERSGYLEVAESEQFGLIINGNRYDPKSKSFEPFRSLMGAEFPKGFRRYQEKDGFIAFNPVPSSNHVVLISPDSTVWNDRFTGGPNDVLDPPFYWVLKPKWIVRRNILDGKVFTIPIELPYSRNPILKNDLTRIWIAGQHRLFSCDKADGNISQHLDFQTSTLRDIMVDDQNLYLLLSDRFVIYRKEFLETLSKLFDNQWYALEVKRFDRALDSLNSGEIPVLKTYLDKQAYLEKEFEVLFKQDSIYDQRRWQSFRPNFWHNLFRKDVVAAIHQDKLPDNILRYTLTDIVSLLSRFGHFSEALYMDSILMSRFPEKAAEVFWHESSIQALRTTVGSIDSLRALYGETDTFLFRKGEALLTLFGLCRFFESGDRYDVSLALGTWQELLDRYPDSKWADNAEFKILELTALFPEDVDMSLQFLDVSKTFLKKYPDSDLKPKIWKEMLQIYADSHYEILGRRQLGLALLEDLKREYPGYLKIEHIHALIKNLHSYR